MLNSFLIIIPCSTFRVYGYIIEPVDRVNEDLSMKDAIDEFEELERSLRNVHPDILSDEDIADYEQSRVEGLEKNRALREHFSAKYNIDWDESDEYFQDLMDEYEIKKEEPLHNV